MGCVGSVGSGRSIGGLASCSSSSAVRHAASDAQGSKPLEWNTSCLIDVSIPAGARPEILDPRHASLIVTPRRPAHHGPLLAAGGVYNRWGVSCVCCVMMID